MLLFHEIRKYRESLEIDVVVICLSIFTGKSEKFEHNFIPRVKLY